VDETDLRAELNRAADADGPPLRINLAAAMTAGRRQRRVRHARTGGSVFAAGAVAATIAVTLALPGPPGRQPAASGATASPAPVLSARAPSRFNPLVPYAAFGRLPAGWHVGQKSTFRGNDLMAMSSATLLYLPVWGPDGGAEAIVFPAGQCRSTTRTLLCNWQNNPWQKLGPAPDVNRHPAYWLGEPGTSPGFAMIGWQYARGAWAVLDSSNSNDSAGRVSASRALDRSLAAEVRFGQAAPILFPYTIHGGLSSWQITEADYTMVNGQPSARMLHLAGGHPAGTIQVDAVPASTPLDGPCDRAGESLDGHASLDGTTVDLFAPAEHEVCGDDIDGLQVDLIFDYEQFKHYKSGVALSYARDLSLLGADQASWQPYPLR
jgi:hypothetical protein